jgi:hypothetical protein
MASVRSRVCNTDGQSQPRDLEPALHPGRELRDLRTPLTDPRPPEMSIIEPMIKVATLVTAYG